MKVLLNILKFERKIIDSSVIILIAVLSTVVIIQVFCRYVLNNSLTWSEELARYAQVWLIMLGSVILFRKKSHLAIDIVTASLPKKVKYFTDCIVHIAIIVFFTIITFYGITLTQNAARQFSPAMMLQMSWVYAALPIGGFLILLEEIPIFIKHLINGFPFGTRAKMMEEDIKTC